jgi:hypothetical protein
VKRFNFSLLVVGVIAGLLLGVLTARPITWTTIGMGAGVALALVIHPKKKSCCQ